MAYVLGYFAADGCIYKNSGGSKYFNFVSTDYKLLEKIKRVLRSSHKIMTKTQANPNCKPTFWLQIGCKEIYEDIIRLGLVPNKEFRLKLPNVPLEYLRHFVRGYFDGDGSVSYGLYNRRDRDSEVSMLMIRFASRSKEFLFNFKRRLKLEADLKYGFIFKGDGCYYLT